MGSSEVGIYAVLFNNNADSIRIIVIQTWLSLISLDVSLDHSWHVWAGDILIHNIIFWMSLTELPNRYIIQVLAVRQDKNFFLPM